MHYLEGDFQSCMRAVREQRDVSLTHFLVSGLNEREAHAALWKAWHHARGEHDIFVKVDADTVLAHDEVLRELWNTMAANDRITGIQAPLHDLFTDGFINGLNAFSPRVTFRDTTDPLYVDRVDVGHDLVVASGDVSARLKPAGMHCYEATDAQAFHYGLHRALKGQSHVIDRVRNAWMRDKDRRRSMALLGAAASPSFADKHGFSYPDDRFKQALATALDRFDELTSLLG